MPGTPIAFQSKDLPKCNINACYPQVVFAPPRKTDPMGFFELDLNYAQISMAGWRVGSSPPPLHGCAPCVEFMGRTCRPDS